jgi:hypothetical protein
LGVESRGGRLSERRIGQLSFGDGAVFQAAGGNEVVERISALIDWVAIVLLLSELRGGKVGAPGYPS